MLNYSLEQVKALSQQYNLIGLTEMCYADTHTPISIFQKLSKQAHCFLLESVEGNQDRARYSFIGRNPFLTFIHREGNTTIEHADGTVEQTTGNPVMQLKQLMEKYRVAPLDQQLRFTGGAVGYFGYDLIRHYEHLPNVPYDDLQLPEAHFMLCDEVIVFDHVKQKILIIVHLHTEQIIDQAYEKACERIEAIKNELAQPLETPKLLPKGKFTLKSNVSKDEFCAMVNKAKQYIKDGDIFQVVLSQRLTIQTDLDPLKVYRALRIINPSPYMYYLKFDDYALVGASPEMLVRVTDGVVRTCPIAGTKPRGKDEQEDAQIAAALLADEKEIAEHNMLVDLGRNDIGKVSKFGTVEVTDYKHIEKYSHVMHVVTNVKGTLAEGKDAYDALMAVMPAGTLSGAPKVRAMEIIDELENVKRGCYGGAIGYIGFDGSLDSCITIRTVVFKNGTAYLQAGAGIVADSIPASEYEETLSKANALLKALEEAGDIA
ncbi:MAG: anthranilate synthase component I [Hyphomonadaceae bacterium]|nr:anthranilate synthase component I [Clostridia bacterium]